MPRRTSATSHVSWVRPSRRWGIAEEDLGDLTRLVGPPFPQAYSQVYGLSEADAAEVTRRYRARYEEGGGAGWPLFEGIPDILEVLHAYGKLVAIASSKRHDLVMRQVRDNGLAEVFDAICGKGGPTRRVRSPRSSSAIPHSRSTERAVAMMPRDLDVIAAGHVGIPCVGVLWGGTAPRAELEDAHAAAVADTVADLEALLTASI